ncbi:MAG: fluoride efflux transporter CrcB [Pirellulaceae bacterium]|nr:fluoride efflux transporter CrcB [Pirellulaceae bacterium]
MKDALVVIGSWATAVLTNKLVALTLGGVLGTHARYWLGRWLDEVGGARGFPLGTFAINISGSFLLGLAAVIILERLPPSQQAWYLLIGTGFCGAFTTFSTFEWETFKLVRDGNFAFALLNIVGSVLVGFLGVLLAVVLTGVVFPRR